MRRIHRIVLLATFLAIAPVLAGCADFDMDKLDVFGLGEKKKLPGDRKPLFPEGVPGVTQGIPQEYIKGNQPPPDAALAAPVEPVAAAPAAEPQQKAVAEPVEKPKPKPKRASTPKPKNSAAAPPVQEAAPAVQQPPPQQAQTPWPAPTATTPSGGAAWPAPPPPGTFQR
jgi:outer membrane biosynthesis protein TonB